MSAKEIIECQMTDMRNQIADANKQVGRIEECLAITEKILSKFEATDTEGVGYRYCYTQQQKESLNELLLMMRNVCKRV